MTVLIGNLIPWRNKIREVGDDATGESAITRFHSEVDRLFERFFGESFWGSSRFFPEWRPWALSWTPSLDVSESEDAITVRAEVPGVDPKDIDISVSGDVLIISGEKKEEREERRENYYRAERSFGSFRRSIPLPASVDRDKISAEYEKGVLTVRLAKSEQAVAKRIPINLKK
jgi:HSP20 family protein